MKCTHGTRREAAEEELRELRRQLGAAREARGAAAVERAELQKAPAQLSGAPRVHFRSLLGTATAVRLGFFCAWERADPCCSDGWS